MIATMILRGFRGVGGWFTLMLVVIVVAAIFLWIANSKSEKS